MRRLASRRWGHGSAVGLAAMGLAAMRLAAVALAALLMAPGCGDGGYGSRGAASPADGGAGAAGADHARSQARGKSKKASRGKSGGAAGTTKTSGEVAREVGAVQRGFAVWYGGELHGKPTASGEAFDKNQLTAAHRTLPMGTTVRVTNQKNQTSVTVRVNDRGPFGKRRERIIDVSEAAAKLLGFIEDGDCPITLEVLTLPEPRKDKAR